MLFNFASSHQYVHFIRPEDKTLFTSRVTQFVKTFSLQNANKQVLGSFNNIDVCLEDESASAYAAYMVLHLCLDEKQGK